MGEIVANRRNLCRFFDQPVAEIVQCGEPLTDQQLTASHVSRADRDCDHFCASLIYVHSAEVNSLPDGEHHSQGSRSTSSHLGGSSRRRLLAVDWLTGSTAAPTDPVGISGVGVVLLEGTKQQVELDLRLAVRCDVTL
jgi:hypothetical protein